MKINAWVVAAVLVIPVIACPRSSADQTGPAAPQGATDPVQAPPAASGQGQGLWASRGCVDDDRGRWFRDAKFGAIIHFGLYSHLGGYYQGKGPYVPSEQIIGLGDRHAVIPPAEYRAKVGAAFNPAKFDAAAWVALMKKAGQKYVILTAKHHDGFCMFRTATTPYNVVEATPFGRDVVRELADECRKQGLVFSVYYSIGDWCAADVQKPGFATYRDYMQAQLRELLTNYGPIRLLWFDNWWYVNDQWKNDEAHARDLYEFARAINPDMLVNDRCGVGVKSDHGDYATPENQLKGSRQSRYFEVVMTDTDDENWGWVKGAANYRSPAVLIRNLVDCVSKGGNFVLNVGPTAEGEFPAGHVAILEAMGAWTSVNGESIYGTEPAPEVSFDQADGATCYATRSRGGDAVYVHVADWPAEGTPLTVRLARVGKVETWQAALLDPSLGQLESTATSDKDATALRITKPANVDASVTVIKLTRSSAQGG